METQRQRICHRKLAFGAFVFASLLLSVHAPTHAMELGPEMRIDEPSRGGAGTSLPPGDTMCARTDDVVFSCPLNKGSKIVSICAGDNGEKTRFYYAYGHAGSPELVYPASGQPADDAFTRTHLGFAGHTGGYAYGFSNKGYKYTVYATSGERNTQNGGVIVQNASNGKVVAKMQCQSDKITETVKDYLIDATLTWKSDSGVASNGLPAQ